MKFEKNGLGDEVGLLKRVWLRSISLKLPSLRFRAKVSLGFAVVLGISAVSMGLAYLGFERISAGVVAYRTSVSESDLARNIDRELTSYQALARYYVVTGKEDDAKAALAAEASLKEAIDQLMKVTTAPARVDKVTRLAREFRTFTKIFADILSVKNASTLLTQNQLTRGGTMLRYKFDDLISTGGEAELPAVEVAAKQVAGQYANVMAQVNTYALNFDAAVGNSATARFKFIDIAVHAISADDERVAPKLKEIGGLLEEYRQAFAKLIENTKAINDLVAEMTESAAAITQGSKVMKADLLADQQRLEKESDATVNDTERLVMMLGIGGFVLGGLLAWMLGKGISRPMVAMCAAMRKLATGDKLAHRGA